MTEEYADLIEQAKTVLANNWLGYATKPAPHLYPHQWSWDSAFIAISYAHYEQARAEQELRSLFAGQWSNGLLPHIVFNPNASDYAPGPEFWQTDRSPHAPPIRTSGIVQPPVHATAAWRIFGNAANKQDARAFLVESYPKLVAWHAYLYRERDINGDGLVYIRHPWESGQDNSPIWDRVLELIELVPDAVPEYRRVDTSIVASADRPSNAEYDRYAYLVKLFRDNDYDEARIRATCPFLVQDVMFNALLVQANSDLAAIARELGEAPAPMLEWARQTTAAMNAKLWVQEDDHQHATYFDYDLVGDAPIHAHVAAGFTPLFAGVPSTAQAEQILATLNACGFCHLDTVCWAVPSYDKLAPGYSAHRYWRGPIWPNVNWLLYHGLQRYTFDAYAERVKHTIIELPRRYGFYEYFDPDAGKGYGSDNSSWTAALLLDVLLAEPSLPGSW